MRLCEYIPRYTSGLGDMGKREPKLAYALEVEVI
jgi:hypothetical protein